MNQPNSINQNPPNSEIRVCLDLAKQLQTLGISKDHQYISLVIRKLHEANLQLEIHSVEWSSVCQRIYRCVEALKNVINQGLDQKGKLKPNLNFYSLTCKKLTLLIQSLNELKNKTENQRIILHSPESESTINILEQLKKFEEKNNIKSQNLDRWNSVRLQKEEERQEALNKLQNEKREVGILMEKLKSDILQQQALQILQKERRKEIEDKSEERVQIINRCPFDQLVRDINEKVTLEKTCEIPRLEKEEKQLQEMISKRTISPVPEIDMQFQKKLHFLFLVDKSETMKGKMKDIKKCLDTLVQDRNDRDKYSLIHVSDKSKVKAQSKKVDPSKTFPLPNPKKSNKGFLEALKQASDIIKKDSSHQYSPMLIIFSDCLESQRMGEPSVNYQLLSILCDEGKKLHSLFKDRGLLVFISYFDLSSQQGLRDFVFCANGERNYIEGPRDNHDFLNHAKDSQKLPQIFRDLNPSLEPKSSILSENEIDARKYRLKNVQADLREKRKFIDDQERKSKELVRQKVENMEKQIDESKKFWSLNDEELIKLEQEEESSKQCLDNCSKNLIILQKEFLELEQSINSLQKEIKEISFQEQKSAPQSCDERLVVINISNIDVGKSLDALKKTKNLLFASFNILSKNLSLLISKTEEISKRLETRVNLEYTQSQISGFETKEEANLGSIIVTGFKNQRTYPILSEINETQCRRERDHQILTSENEFLSQCLDIQHLISNSFSQNKPS